jgi:hypothetical protein
MTGVVLYRTSDGLVICSRHADEVFGVNIGESEIAKPQQTGTTKGEVVPRVEQFTYEDGCTLCRTPPVEGHTCGTCNAPLHPNWPAIYCSTACALADI